MKIKRHQIWLGRQLVDQRADDMYSKQLQVGLEIRDCLVAYACKLAGIPYRHSKGSEKTKV